jgi:hypothetical protein
MPCERRNPERIGYVDAGKPRMRHLLATWGVMPKRVANAVVPPRASITSEAVWRTMTALIIAAVAIVKRLFDGLPFCLSGCSYAANVRRAGWNNAAE